jgi:glycosyltransferase involved in cell wall biosynthesis
MDAVAALRASVRAQLVVVGGGSAFEPLQARAGQINRSHGERVVVLTGPLSDPRSAYAAADLVVGMGSSVLRGMAFGKAAVVVGERGFSLPVAPDTLPVFDRSGFYGVGAGRPAPADDPLVEQIAGLLGDAGLRAELGRFGAELVHARFSLESVADRLDVIYADTAAHGPGRIRRGADAVGTAGRIVLHKASGRVAQLRTGGG